MLTNIIITQCKSQEHYKDVFKPLDGTWKGTFEVLEDINGQKEGKAQPKNISEEFMNGLDLEKTFELDVKQIYVSTSPYYQTVVIEDTYLENGKEKTVISKGYNEVKNGELICVVNKPDEQVIHQGYTEGDKTIIWHRSIKEPLKVEFFRETVKANTYSIIGWGYYGNDDADLTPKTWFRAVYERVQ